MSLRVKFDSKGFDDIERDFDNQLKSLEGTVSVIVGYTANYALWVHENVGASFNVGQAKFLEEPARTKEAEMINIVSKMLEANQPMSQAIVTAGLFLQREAQQRTPVDTGNLKASAFTRRET